MKKYFTIKCISQMLIILLILGSSINIFASVPDVNTNMRDDIETTVNYLINAIPNPSYGIVGGDWSLIGLARSGIEAPEGYVEKYLENIEAMLTEKKGELTRNKYSEYSRLILAVASLGKDPANIAGYNLLEKLTDLELIERQGINGPIYALIALDSMDYEVCENKEAKVQVTRDLLIESILKKEIIGGGFSLGGDVADPDVTAAVLQAFSKYRDNVQVNASIDRALSFLSESQLSTGGFSGWTTGGVENAESIAQIIVALTSLGVDPLKDNRFIKADIDGRKHSLLDALSEFRFKNGGYRHLENGDIDVMATEQAMLALVSYDRFKSKKSPIYDMKDAMDLPQGEKYQYKVLLNGKYMVFDQPPIIVNSRILVPMRAIFEALGAKVNWDPVQRKVAGEGDGKRIELVIGENHAYIDGERVELAKVNESPVPAMIKNGRTLIPLRFISESLNAFVEWDGQTNTAIIEK